MKSKKSTDGVFTKRAEDRTLSYFWKIGAVKSKDFRNQELCAQDFIQKYVERYPKYEPVVQGKTWEQCYAIFGIQLTSRRST